MGPKKLSLNLVTYNGEKYLPFLAASLKQQTFKDFDLKIIDNGSSDNTLESLAQFFPENKPISYQKNLGFAKAHNLLIAWTKELYLLILNQDIVLTPDYLEKAVKFLDNHAEASGVMGKILKWDFANNKPTNIIDSLGIKIYKTHQAVDIRQGEKDDNKNTEPIEVFGLSGAAAFFRREDLEKIKITFGQGNGQKQEYFDEDFFSYKEDIDLAYRLQLAGLKTFLLPEIITYHGRGAGHFYKNIKQERDSRPSAVKIYSYRNHLSTLVKNEFFINRLKYFWPIFWYEFKKFTFLLIFERSTLKGLLMFRQDKPKMKQKRKFIIKNIRKIQAEELAKWYE